MAGLPIANRLAYKSYKGRKVVSVEKKELLVRRQSLYNDRWGEAGSSDSA